MDAFDALKAIRYQGLKTGPAQRRRQSNSPKGAFTVSQYPDNQNALDHPEGEGEGTGAVQLTLPELQNGPIQLVLPVASPDPWRKLPRFRQDSAQPILPIASVDPNDLLSRRLQLVNKPAPVQGVGARQDKCWDRPHLKPIRENAYRILGLPGDADFPTIQKRADELKLQAKLGKRFKTEWDFDWLGPMERTEATVQEALWRLSNPGLRLRERFFWFTGKHPGAVSNYQDDGEWQEEFIDAVLSNPEFGHDIALYILAKMASASFMDGLKNWQLLLPIWELIALDDTFWGSLRAKEARGEFLNPASGEEVDQFRQSCLLQVTEGLVSQAQQALIDKDDAAVEAILAVIDEADLAKYVDEQIEQSIFGFMKTDLEKLYDDLLTEKWRQDAMKKLKEELLPLYGRLSKLLKLESRLLQQIQETVLQCFYRILTLWTWSGDESDFLYLHKEARRIAPPDSLVLPRIELLVKGCRNE